MSSQQAFDPLAPLYDATFTHTRIGRFLRSRVHDRLDQYFHTGDHVLELGCGTGEDALYLVGRGVQVTATDVSEAMLDNARAKAGNNPMIQFERLDLRELTVGAIRESPLSPNHTFDGAFSNFGALNVLKDWRPLAVWLAEHVKPGGVIAFGVMSPLCLWEILWHGLHLDIRTATRRLRKSTSFQPYGANEPISVHYPTIRRLTRDLAPWFRRTHVAPLGLFLPPSDVFGVIEKRPGLMRALMSMENRFAGTTQLALFADHYWIEFERKRGE